MTFYIDNEYDEHMEPQERTQLAEETQIPQPSPHKRSWKKYAEKIGIVVVLLSVAFTIYIVYEALQFMTCCSIIFEPDVSTVTSQPTQDNTLKRTTQWVTYTNDVHNYIVSYPPEWTVNTYEANNVEDYSDSLCCNTAKITISNGSFARWEFTINELYTGFSPPTECESSSVACSFDVTPMDVMGYELERGIVRSNSSGKIIEGYLTTPADATGYGHKGFGQVGFSTQYVSADHTKYFINYEGSEIDRYLETLDSITKSLQYLE